MQQILNIHQENRNVIIMYYNLISNVETGFSTLKWEKN